MSGKEFLEDILILFENQLNQAIGTRGRVEHRAVMTGAAGADAGLRESGVVFADITAEVVVKKVPEKSQHAWFAKAVVSEHAGDFAAHILAGAHAAFGDGLAELGVGLDVAESMVDGEAEFPVLQHHATMLVGLSGGRQLGAEESIAIKKNGGEPHDRAVFFADLVDGVFDNLQVISRLFFGGGTKSHCFKNKMHSRKQAFVVDALVLHQGVDRCHGTNNLGVVNNGNRRSTDVALRLDFVVSLWVVRDLFRESDQTFRAVGHVAQNIFRLAEDLRGFGAVDGVKIRVILQSMFARGGEHDRHTLDGGGIGNRAAFPTDDAVGAEVEFQFAAVIGGHHIPARALAGLGGIVRRLGIDQFVESRDVFLRRDAPNSRRR